MQWYVLRRSRPLTKTLTGTYFKAHSGLATLIQFQTHVSPSTFTSGGHGVVRPRTSPAPNTTQRLQTCSAYLRQNSLRPKREWTSPPPGNVLSRGQAASSCAQRKVFLSGLRNLAGWATGTTRLAAPPGPDRTVTRAFYCTSVKHFSAPLRPLSIPHHSAEEPKPTHILDCITVLVKTFYCLTLTVHLLQSNTDRILILALNSTPNLKRAVVQINKMSSVVLTRTETQNHTHTPSEGLNPGLSAAGRIGRLHRSADIDSVNTISVDWHECERGRLLRGRLRPHSTAAWNFSGYRNIIKKYIWTNKKIWLIPHAAAYSEKLKRKYAVSIFIRVN